MNKRKILGLCNLHSSPFIGGLNERRALGSVTFLGRYALMDFTLSNFANSGIDNVCILVHHYPHSVVAHVGSGDVWTSNTKTGCEYIFFNEFGLNNPEHNTDINNIIANKTALVGMKHQIDYVVVAPAHYLSCMNFEEILEDHIAKNEKITTVYVPINDGKKNFRNSAILNIDETGHVESHQANNGQENNINVALQTFIINADLFDRIIKKSQTIDRSYSISKMIDWLMKNEGLKVNAYRFEHQVIPITSMDDYYYNSFALLSYDYRRKLFREDWPIYTRTHDTPPAYYAEKASVKDSIISNGCIIKGKVEHSILSRNVVIEEGAHVKDCIVFTNSVIKEGVKVQNILTDKSVVISKDLGGKDEPVFVKLGSKI